MKTVFLKLAVSLSFIFLMQSAYGDAEAYLQNPSELFALLPDYQEIIGESHIMGGKESGDLHLTFDKNGNRLNMTLISDFLSAEVVINSNFEVVSSVQSYTITDEEMLKKMDFNKRSVTLSADGSYTIYLYQDNDLVETKSAKLIDGAIDIEVIQLFLQAMMIGGIDTFKSHVYVKEGGFKIKVEFTLIESDDLKSLMPDLDYPENFDLIVESSDSYSIYEATPKGLAGLFTDIKYFVAFEKEYPNKIVAYWGGPKNYAEFFFTTE